MQHMLNDALGWPIWPDFRPFFVNNFGLEQPLEATVVVQQSEGLSDHFSCHMAVQLLNSCCTREFYGKWPESSILLLCKWPLSGWGISTESHCISLKFLAHGKLLYRPTVADVVLCHQVT